MEFAVHVLLIIIKCMKIKKVLQILLKTKRHQQWLQSLNHNKSNYYVENIRNLITKKSTIHYSKD